MSIDGTGRATSSTSTTRTTPTQPGGYTVRRGDNLNHIAKDHGVGLNELIAANPQIRNPNMIHPGQVLNIPERAASVSSPVESPRHHTVSSGVGPRPPSGGLAHDTHRARFEHEGLRRGSTGPAVADLQRTLNGLGFDSGPADGQFGPRTQNALRDFQRSQSIPPDGVLNARTREALASPAPVTRTDPSTSTSAPNLRVYEPNSPEARALFRDAARLAGVPESWADSAGLHNILRRESGGRVGVPNYTYGSRARDPSQWGSIHDELKAGRITARSSATGLGQLLLSNVDRYYPNGRAGIGDPVQEAAGMLAYIKDRYGSPDNAWRLYGTRHEGY